MNRIFKFATHVVECALIVFAALLFITAALVFSGCDQEPVRYDSDGGFEVDGGEPPRADASAPEDAGTDAQAPEDSGQPDAWQEEPDSAAPGLFYAEPVGGVSASNRCAQEGGRLANVSEFIEGQVPLSARPPNTPEIDFCVRAAVSWSTNPQAVVIDFNRDGMNPYCPAYTLTIYIVCIR